MPSLKRFEYSIARDEWEFEHDNLGYRVECGTLCPMREDSYPSRVLVVSFDQKKKTGTFRWSWCGFVTTVDIEFPKDAYLVGIRPGNEHLGSVVSFLGGLFVPHEVSYEFGALCDAAKKSDKRRFIRTLDRLNFGDPERKSSAMVVALQLALDAEFVDLVPRILAFLDRADVRPYRISTPHVPSDFIVVWKDSLMDTMALHRLVVNHFGIQPEEYADWGDYYRFSYPRKFVLPWLLDKSLFL